MNKPIGVIDSGVGGLTVAKEIIRQRPNESILYLGDTARCPYGPRPTEEVRELTWQMVRHLLKQDIKMLVIACNTATAVAFEEIRDTLPIPVVGVINPGARSALQVTRNYNVGVIGTVGTIKSKAYEHALQEIHPQIQVTSLACPLFVPLVEAGTLHSQEAKDIIAESLKPLKETDIDTLILGCTHYPLLKTLIQEVMGDDIHLIDSAKETAREMSTIISHNNIAATSTTPNHQFYSTGGQHVLRNLVNQWLQLRSSVNRISL
ncbi:glutamate racemase [Pullulanibacillus pueri]|uniref:Glutamate racemase n=1 Tax=Pullulanibacillus pueri TaxID=1437324 RepID=A0A8J2ZWX0_9BACL|nr:glutamate racemase [Pullulanibacillus pueri]MBM7681994.1 glutamate racemase [Pullulanibacillus pueri]GGH83691.1 glutamate racemase [Pullulanibacillus pueri]